MIHRLVATLFINNPDDLPEVDHVHGVKFDNYFENLRWCTSSQNTLYAFETGIYKAGGEHPRAKLTDEQVIEIRTKYIPNHPQFGAIPLSKVFGVHELTIRRIVHGLAYKGVGGTVHAPIPKPRVSDENRAQIKLDHAQGMSICAIARKYSIAHETVRDILGRRRPRLATEIST